MSFEAGHKKAGGRKKGTPNKKSGYLSEALEARQFEPVDRLVEILPNLPIEKQAQVILHLLTFIYPKRKATTDTSDDSNKEVSLVFDFQDRNL